AKNACRFMVMSLEVRATSCSRLRFISTAGIGRTLGGCHAGKIQEVDSALWRHAQEVDSDPYCPPLLVLLLGERRNPARRRVIRIWMVDAEARRRQDHLPSRYRGGRKTR